MNFCALYFLAMISFPASTCAATEAPRRMPNEPEPGSAAIDASCRSDAAIAVRAGKAGIYGNPVNPAAEAALQFVGKSIVTFTCHGCTIIQLKVIINIHTPIISCIPAHVHLHCIYDFSSRFFPLPSVRAGTAPAHRVADYAGGNGGRGDVLLHLRQPHVSRHHQRVNISPSPRLVLSTLFTMAYNSEEM